MNGTNFLVLKNVLQDKFMQNYVFVFINYFSDEKMNDSTKMQVEIALSASFYIYIFTVGLALVYD